MWDGVTGTKVIIGGCHTSWVLSALDFTCHKHTEEDVLHYNGTYQNSELDFYLVNGGLPVAVFPIPINGGSPIAGG